ncbi:VCBS domain-containing protein, partial [Salipiger bermudensis]|uniref:VCBS domain-containing protein n=1 Tax=Salipiger bermudensis TaxID=344736 RepID=UPI00300AC25D
GRWTYTADNAQQAVQGLNAGGTPLTDTIQVTSVDGTTHDLVVTIAGTNDGPTVSHGDLGSTDQDQPRSFTEAELLQSVQATDIDTGDRLSIQSVSVDPQFGSFAKTAGGDWAFHPAAGISHDNVPVQIIVQDASGTPVTASADLDITPLPQVAQVQGVGTQHLTGSIAGLTGGWGIAAGGSGASVVSMAGKYGTLTIDPHTGQFEYTYNPDSAVIKHGGDDIVPGLHTDPFTIVRHGQTVGDAQVEVRIDVQSVHGNSGHHIDHTTLQGITLVPVAPAQHEEPDLDVVETVTFSPISEDLPDVPDHDGLDATGLSGAHDADPGAPPDPYHDAAGIAATAEHADAPESVTVGTDRPVVDAPDDSIGHTPVPEPDPMAHYLDAVGTRTLELMPPAEHAASPYLGSLGISPADLPEPAQNDVPDDPSLLHEPAGLDVDHHADTVADHELPVDDPVDDPSLYGQPDPTDDTNG